MIRDRAMLAALLDATARFVRETLVPLEEEISQTDRIPESIVQAMREMGLFGMTIPEEYGGLGLTAEEEMLVVFELARTSPAFRSLIGTNNGIGSTGLIFAGTPAQKAQYLPRLASGQIIGSFALTEASAGSDPGSLRTMATREGDFWVLNGTKRYITNAPEAGLFTIFTRTDRSGASEVSAFLVEAGTAGLLLGRIDRKMGQRGAHTCDVILENCRVPSSAMLGQEGAAFRTAMRTLDRGRLHIAALCVGVAERLLADAIGYAKDRRQFGQPIANFQLIQAMLADSRTEIYAGRCMVIDAARRRDAGEQTAAEASCCKLYCSEMVGRVADRAVQIHGGAGYMGEYAVERFYRDVRLFRIYEGTSQIQQLIIARHLLTDGAVL
jgi:acyl-CoA dehydrogenase